MFAPPLLVTWLSTMIPLVPPRALGAVTHVDVGVVVQFGEVNELVIVELSTNPSFELLPTPKNRRSVAPS